jgi:hypothetical protein
VAYIVIGVGGLIVMGLAYGLIPGGDKLVWVWRPPRNRVAAAFVFCVFAGLLAKGLAQVVP